jgi:hypothetical protein
MELVDWQKKRGRRTATTSREVSTVREVLPKGFEERLAALEEKCIAFATFGSAFDGLASRIKAMEGAQTRIADNDPGPVPRAFGDLVERVLAIETNMASQANIDELASIIGDIGNAGMTHASVLSKRIDALEARVSNLPSDLLAEVGRAQAELSARRT